MPGLYGPMTNDLSLFHSLFRAQQGRKGLEGGIEYTTCVNATKLHKPESEPTKEAEILLMKALKATGKFGRSIVYETVPETWDGNGSIRTIPNVSSQKNSKHVPWHEDQGRGRVTTSLYTVPLDECRGDFGRIWNLAMGRILWGIK